LTVEAQETDPDSTLSFYRRALALRRTRPGGALTWHDAPPDVLHFTGRGGLRCVVNLGSTPVPLPQAYGDPVLTSGPLDAGKLPPETAAWF
jgi:alpha-glucosidase